MEFVLTASDYMRAPGQWWEMVWRQKLQRKTPLQVLAIAALIYVRAYATTLAMDNAQGKLLERLKTELKAHVVSSEVAAYYKKAETNQLRYVIKERSRLNTPNVMVELGVVTASNEDEESSPARRSSPRSPVWVMDIRLHDPEMLLSKRIKNYAQIAQTDEDGENTIQQAIKESNARDSLHDIAIDVWEQSREMWYSALLEGLDGDDLAVFEKLRRSINKNHWENRAVELKNNLKSVIDTARIEETETESKKKLGEIIPIPPFIEELCIALQKDLSTASLDAGGPIAVVKATAKTVTRVALNKGKTAYDEVRLGSELVKQACAGISRRDSSRSIVTRLALRIIIISANTLTNIVFALYEIAREPDLKVANKRMNMWYKKVKSQRDLIRSMKGKDAWAKKKTLGDALDLDPNVVRLLTNADLEQQADDKIDEIMKDGTIKLESDVKIKQINDARSALLSTGKSISLRTLFDTKPVARSIDKTREWLCKYGRLAAGMVTKTRESMLDADALSIVMLERCNAEYFVPCSGGAETSETMFNQSEEILIQFRKIICKLRTRPDAIMIDPPLPRDHRLATNSNLTYYKTAAAKSAVYDCNSVEKVIAAANRIVKVTELNWVVHNTAITHQSIRGAIGHEKNGNTTKLASKTRVIKPKERVMVQNQRSYKELGVFAQVSVRTYWGYWKLHGWLNMKNVSGFARIEPRDSGSVDGEFEDTGEGDDIPTPQEPSKNAWSPGMPIWVDAQNLLPYSEYPEAEGIYGTDGKIDDFEAYKLARSLACDVLVHNSVKIRFAETFWNEYSNTAPREPSKCARVLSAYIPPPRYNGANKSDVAWLNHATKKHKCDLFAANLKPDIVRDVRGIRLQENLDNADLF